MKSPDMQVSTCRLYSNLARYLVYPVLMILCLGVFMAPPAFACHKGKPHGPHVCDGGDDGGGEDEGPVVGGPTLVSFMGPDVLDEDTARECTPLELTSAAGRFDCSVAQPVRATTAGMNLQARKRDINLCRSLEHFSRIQGVSNVDDANPIMPDLYQYGWTDSCSDGACQIVVDLSFSGPAISAVTGGKSDAIDLRVTGTLSGPPDGNPFSGTQELAMSQMSMQFRKPGSNAIAAVCDWYPQSVEIGVSEHVVFTSFAMP